MKTTRMAMAAALAGMLFTSTASAQQPARSNAGSLKYPSSAKQVAYEYDNYYQPAEPPSPSDMPEVEPVNEPSVRYTTVSSPAEGIHCNSETYDPFRLFNGESNWEQATGLNAQGWVAQSYTQNFYSPRDRWNGPVTWTDRSNEYQLNEVYTTFQRAADNEGEGLALGFRVDTLYGTSARFTTAAGLEDRINKAQKFYGLAFPNLYADVAYNDLKVKVGHFTSPVGYFAVGTYNNFFNALPYTFQYGEPFTHTGVLGQYQMTDDVNVGLGITRGWDNFAGYNNGVSPCSITTFANILTEGDSFAYFNIWSREQGVDGAYPSTLGTFGSRYLQTCVYSMPLTDNLTYVIQSDFGIQGQAFGPGVAQGAAADPAQGNVARWYGVNQYFYYKVNNCWSWGLNMEWFRDEQGFRVGGFLPNITNNTNGGPTATRGLPSGVDAGEPFRGGYVGNFWQMTFGPKWTPHPNLVIRPNLRWDWFTGQVDTIRNPGGFLPFGDGIMNTQGILATDLMVVW